MLAEPQRAAILAAMGIDVYRLRVAAACAAPVRIGLDAQSCVCVDGIDTETTERLFALLPAALGIARERMRYQDADATMADAAIEIDVSALRGDGKAKRALWNSLKPLARRLYET